MRKALFITCFCYISLTSFTQQHKFTTNNETIVYVCGKSKIYHKVKTHSALGRCTSGIKELTEQEAVSYGKRVCKCRG